MSARPKEQCVRDYLRNCCGIDDKHLDRMYHPSMIETYRAALPDAAGILRLGSPRTDSIRNPMAMRALFRLRILLNTLLRQGKIDRTTKINIEFSRNLHDANHRKGIRTIPARPRSGKPQVCRRAAHAVRGRHGPHDRTDRDGHPEIPPVEGAAAPLHLHGKANRNRRLHRIESPFRHRAHRAPVTRRRRLAEEQDAVRLPLQPRGQTRQVAVGTRRRTGHRGRASRSSDGGSASTNWKNRSATKSARAKTPRPNRKRTSPSNGATT